MEPDDRCGAPNSAHCHKMQSRDGILKVARDNFPP